MYKIISIVSMSLLIIFFITSCTEQNKHTENNQKSSGQLIEKNSIPSIDKQAEAKLETKEETKSDPVVPDEKNEQHPINKGTPETDSTDLKQSSQNSTAPMTQHNSVQVVANPASIPVLINKLHKLPDGYIPGDLVYTTIPFVFAEKTEKRKMRSEAAVAIEKLFASANQQGISLSGVSAYRSHSTQTTLFNYYVKKDGYAKAISYSALPGTSEHETGLAIDVTGASGKCPAQDCFGNTKEANWLQAHSAKFGFIIRYPKGKESITGYKYEPWHLRYVGTSIAEEIMSQGITLEEYNNALPVNK